jgi:hypothetical protein
MAKYSSGLIYFTIVMGFAIWLLWKYFQEAARIDALESIHLNNVSLLEINDYDLYYTVCTDKHDTLHITKQYTPGLTWPSLAKANLKSPFTLDYIDDEIVNLRQGSHIIVDTPYKELKKVENEDISLFGFYALLLSGAVVLAITFSIPKVQKWLERKIEQSILQIPHTEKRTDYLFAYRYKDCEILIHHHIFLTFSKTGNRHLITVYIPILPEKLVKPIKMEIDAFHGTKYYNFSQKINFNVDSKKLQQQIDSRFI